MSRSHKHTPIMGNTTAKSEKADKRSANRKLRRKVKSQINVYIDVDTILISDLREVSNLCGFAKDGKNYIDRPKPEWMRK